MKKPDRLTPDNVMVILVMVAAALWFLLTPSCESRGGQVECSGEVCACEGAAR